MADTVTAQQLIDKHPEAYNLMIAFYCNTKYYNSNPDCRPADNVLMAIQFTLDSQKVEFCEDEGCPHHGIKHVCNNT